LLSRAIELIHLYEENWSTSSRRKSKREWCSRFPHLILLATVVRIDHHTANTNWISQSTQKSNYLKLLWPQQTCIRLQLHLMFSMNLTTTTTWLVSDYNFKTNSKKIWVIPKLQKHHSTTNNNGKKVYFSHYSPLSSSCHLTNF